MAGISQVRDYDTWTPQTENTLDLRLAIFSDEESENEILSRKANEMNENLECLYTQASYISLDAYVQLLENCPNLRVLNLCCAKKTGHAALGIIAKFKKLEELNLHFASYASVIEQMGQYERVPDFAKREGITDDIVETILNNCPNLKKLDLSGAKITERTLELIASNPNITFLKILQCWDLNKAEVEKLKEARSDLVIIDARVDDPELDATAAFEQLTRKVKPRYYQEVRIEGESGFRLKIKDDVDLQEKELIAPSVFFDT
jgi:Leucine-rich repeat (LRR) protein